MIKLSSEFKKIHPWMLSYFRQNIALLNKKKVTGPIHIFVAICDHFEPLWAGASVETGLKRVRAWHEQYPQIARGHKDSDGFVPKYSFFYPIEEYRLEYLELLADLCKRGFGEVEVHLHHDNDTAENLKNTLLRYIQMLRDEHRLLCRDKHSGELRYGFIHGNWALDNSNPDGRWCGVNNELQVLQETGCYSDFTMPSAPHVTQTRKINSIYYAKGIEGKSKSHDTGIDVVAGIPDRAGLMMIQGPLMFNWQKRKFGFLPGIENGLLDQSSRFTYERADLWLKSNVNIFNRPDCLFIKLHAHGCQENNIKSLLGKDLNDLFSYFESAFNDGQKYRLHYTSAREMYNIIKALEAGEPGNPGDYRDYQLIKFMDEHR